MRYLHPDRSANGRKAGEGIQCGDRLSGFYSASHSRNTWLQVVENRIVDINRLFSSLIITACELIDVETN